MKQRVLMAMRMIGIANSGNGSYHQQANADKAGILGCRNIFNTQRQPDHRDHQQNETT